MNGSEPSVNVNPAVPSASPDASRASFQPSRTLPVWLSGGMVVVDGEGKITSVSDPLAVWLGATPGELQGQSFVGLIGQSHPEWMAPLNDLLRRTVLFDRMDLAVREGRRTEGLHIEMCCHGELRFLHLDSVLPPVGDLNDAFPEGSWRRMATHKVFHRLLRVEAQLDNLARHWPGIIFSQRPDFSFAFISPKIEELTGVSVPEWQRQSRFFWQVVHESDTETLQKRLARLGDSPEGVTNTYRIRHIRTGRVTYLWEYRQAVRSSNGLLLGYEGIWLDITRQTLAERRLLSLSWKENLSTLTMGLAHDFCNIMTGIVSLSETFEIEFAENEAARAGLSLIRTTAGQASELTRRIRQLHQGSPGEKCYHDLNEIITNIVGVLQKVLARRVKILMELEPSQLPVYLDAIELQQVVVNLALNAADAMPNGGSLTIRTATVAEAPKREHFHGSLPRGRAFRLSVSDTGVGISKKHLNSIFDPYFTTKPIGKGSGLGLYNARLFAENHGAAISVESCEQVGTTFDLWFPQADFTEADSALKTTPSARHTLLVFGHEGEINDRMVETLQKNGFYAVGAATPTNALEMLHSPDYSFDGVLMLCREDQADHVALLQRVRSEKLPVKMFLSFIGRNQDEVEASLLEGLDEVFPQDLPLPGLFTKIRETLSRV
jgi:PAS domain S-box-containing protein